MNMNRRKFVAQAGAACVLAGLSGVSRVCGAPAERGPSYTVRCLTRGPNHHFFGYYGICPWNASARQIVCLESPFQDHMPSREEPAAIGLVDVETGKFSQVATTHAWNFQQGAMLHWNPLHPDTEIIYNNRTGDEIVSVILDLKTGGKRRLPRAVNAISHSGKYALSLTYGRLGRLRKVVGYSGIEDPNPNTPHPDNDGVFLLDLTTGQSRLVVSIRQVYEMLKERHPELENAHMWFNHVVFNRSDTRFFFLARTRKPSGGLETGMFTVNVDGSDLREVIPYGKSVSHFDWRNDREIIATFNLLGRGRTHVLFTDGKANYQHLGNGCLDFDGHCTFSPDQQWLATDRRSSGAFARSLVLYDMQRGECTTLAKIDMKEKRFVSGDLRCDFHPRWSRTGDAICFDAIEPAGTRQLHIAHLSF